MRRLPLVTLVISLLLLMVGVSAALAITNLGEDGEEFSTWGEDFNANINPEDLPPAYYELEMTGLMPEEEFRLVLINDAKDPLEEYDQQRWEAVNSETEAVAECLGRDGTADDCVNEIEDGETRIPRGTSIPEIQDGADAVETARDYGTDLDPEISDELDLLGEESGTLDAGAIDLAGDAFAGNLLLVPAAFTLGVAIGNGLDQLFGLKEWNWGAEVAPREAAREHSENEGVRATFYKYNEDSLFPIAGYYISGKGCNGVEYCSAAEVKAAAEKINAYYTCYEYDDKGVVDGAGHGSIVDGCAAGGQLLLVCESSTASAPCSPTPEAYDEYGTAEPAGIPTPNAPGIEEDNLSYAKKVEEQNAEYGSKGSIIPTPLPSSPEAPAAPHLPTKTSKRGSVIPKTIPSEVITHETVREIIETSKGTPEEIVKEEHEKAKKLIPEPRPGETAEQYKNRLETIGFTDVAVDELTETDEDPDVGPEVVTKVSPSPGSEVATDEKITVDENPKTAPTSPGEPGGEPGEPTAPVEGEGVIGPPTEPGFHLPELGVLCKGFPFGVPCWLATTVSSWSGTSKAPELGLEEITIDNRKIPAGTFDLAHLEPEMEYIRPAMVIFATIGLVLLFFSFAKGGGPPSGSQGDSGGSDKSYTEEG